MHPLLNIADDLERRDAHVAGELARVEAEQAEVDALRTRAAATAELLLWLAQEIAENEDALVRARQQVARLEEHRDAFARQRDDANAEAAGLAHAVGAPDLEATIAALSQRRGALLVERSGLARERESIVREASELLGSVLGDPHAATSVAGLRERLERALP